MTLDDIKAAIKQKPYHEEAAGVLYCADALDILPQIPDKAVDLVLTDPPYGVGKMVSGTMSKARLHKTKYDLFEDTPEYVGGVCSLAIKICIQMFGRVVLTPGYKCMRAYPEPDSMGCFYMPATMGMQLWGGDDFQPILYYGKPFDIGKRIHKCSYVVTERPSCSQHPCAKPFKVWRNILSTRSSENHIILDPFLGSGTTAVAAKQLGRKFIGVEISEAYCRVAVERLKQSVLNLTVDPIANDKDNKQQSKIEEQIGLKI